MAEAARVLDLDNEKYVYGSAAPAREAYPEAPPRPIETPYGQELIRQRERDRAAAALENLPGVSLFAMLGSLFVAALMVFVVLAQISYNETATETVRLNAQLLQLTEQQRRLEITFESVINMKEVEQYARDVLGMSKPEPNQTTVLPGAPTDRAEVLAVEQRDTLRDFGSFISSLLDYFR